MSRSRRRRKISSKQVPVICALVLLVGTSALFFVFICPYLTTEYSLGIPVYEGLLTFFVLASFAHAIFKDPGIIPRAPNVDQQDDFRSPLYKNVDINGITVRMKWCDTCKFYRPPRCSHCSICNCCIENFDHHCPWVDNCIGRRNYRFFFLFVTSLSCHIASVFGLTLVHALHTRENTKDLVVSVVIMVICGITAVPVFGLSIFHIGLVTMGRTTNEQVTGKFRSGHNPFDLGCCNNVGFILCTTQHPKYLGYEEKRKEKEAKQKKPEKKSDRNKEEMRRHTDTERSTELTEVKVHVPAQATGHMEKDARTPNGMENMGRRPESFITAVNQAPRAAAMYSHSTTSNGRDARKNKEVTV